MNFSCSRAASKAANGLSQSRVGAATAAGSTAGAVHFSAPYKQLNGVWSYEHDRAVSADWNWGTTFPGNNWMVMTFELIEPGVDYDTTIAVEWGPGVPVDASTWGDVKALYR
jgi:hypothetical protein